MTTIDQVLSAAPVIPVVTIKQASDAVPLARALAAGGLPIIEVTLRTAAALEAITAIRSELPDVLVGAGTIWNARDLGSAASAGAQFGVSPGATPRLLDAVLDLGMPFLPGCQTPSEVADRVERGFDAVKFFPAGPAGGLPALKALTSVFPQVRFCPTGGVNPETAPGYLALRGVPVVGGSWLAPGAVIREGAWGQIEELAQAAAALAA